MRKNSEWMWKAHVQCAIVFVLACVIVSATGQVKVEDARPRVSADTAEQKVAREVPVVVDEEEKVATLGSEAQAVLGNVSVENEVGVDSEEDMSALARLVPTLGPLTSYKNVPTGQKGTTVPKPVELDFCHVSGLDIKKALVQSTDEEAKPRPQNESGFVSVKVGWVPLMTETFEGSFPSDNNWKLYYNNDSGEQGYGYTWDDVSNRYYNGSRSGWCADVNLKGQADIDPPGPYPNNLNSWMVYGPFDLSGAVDAEVQFYCWNNSEADYDIFSWFASTDGEDFYGYKISGDHTTWQLKNFDLTNVQTLGNLCGHSQVWIALRFKSDNSVAFEGVYVDDILLQANYSPYTVNLKPYQPSGWDDAIVVSSVQETHTDGPQLVAGLSIYVDYAYINDSNDDIADRFLTDLLVDGLVVRTSSKSGLDANHYGYGTDREITVTTPGWHSIALMVDTDDAIGEFDEDDNYYERQFYVEAPPNVPNLIPYQPSSWDDRIVVSSVTDTHTDGPSLVAGQSIYVDYAYLNDSDADVPETFLSEILIDGSVVTVSSKSGLQAHYYGYGSDREFTVNTPGWHTIAIRVDKDNAVDEYNEDDNYYERNFYLEPPGTAEPDIHVYPTVLHIYKE